VSFDSGEQARNQGEAFGAFAPPKFSKHCIAILTFAETLKNKDEILIIFKKSYLNFSLSCSLIISLQNLS